MTVFKEENKGKRIRPNREVIIYSLLIFKSRPKINCLF